MRRILAGVVVVALLTPWLLFGQPRLQQTAPSKSKRTSVEQDLIKLEAGWSVAAMKGDVAFIEGILADDYTDTDPEGTVTTKAQDIADLKAGVVRLDSVSTDDYKVHVYGKAAVVTGRNTVKGEYKGKDISGQYRWTDTWVKRGGHWQCVASHASRIAEKK